MIYKLLYLNQQTGEHGLFPDWGISNIGGTSSPTFTVNGKALLFSDGSSTDGLGNTSFLTLQGAYNASSNGEINLATGKHFLIRALNSKFLSVNPDTGNVTISGDLTVQGSINNINLTQFFDDFTDHITYSPAIKHQADEIGITGPFTNVTGTNVEEALESIDAQLSNVGAAAIKTWEHVQAVAGVLWTITHNKNSLRPSVSIYDTNNDQIYPDEVHIVDANTITVSFNSAQDGRAIILMF
jgi:hypothetical protein